jgi:uncharacterized protein YkwD
MVQKHMVMSMIAPVAVAGILIMTILAATVNAQESNNTGNARQESSSTENATSPMTSNNTGNEQQESNNTGNATSTGVPENTTSPSGSTTNNNTGNEQQESNSNMTAAAPNIGNARQESNNTGNATSTGMSADLANGILTLMNQERAAVNASGSVPPLVWNDTAAAHAKDWAEYLAAGKTGALGITHCIFVPGWEQI